MEELIHYVWKHKLFPLQPLRTTTGEELEVIDVGLHNTDAGPDFFNAKIKIGDTMWVGNVEIHHKSTDWNKHKHHLNAAYDSVILHVAAVVDAPIHRTNGETIPQLQLICPPSVAASYETLRISDFNPRCVDVLRSLSTFTIHSYLSALQTERLEQKVEQIEKRLANAVGSWEEAFFITLARNFGFGLNGDAFERWANLIPLNAVNKHRDSLFQVEAIFFGQAGLLQETISSPYYAGLQTEYAYLQHKFERQPMDPILWRFLRLRPNSFPHIRIAQLAQLYSHSEGLFSLLLEANTIDELKKLLRTHTSEYWETHYSFAHTSDKRTKNLSDPSCYLLIINTVIPFLYAYGRKKGNDVLCERAANFLHQLKPENNHITRAWSLIGINATNAADSQALIQLQNEYCNKKRCLNCRIGYEYLSAKHKYRP